MLFVAATPIGNLGDITLRTIQTLRSATTILCEDPRMARKLLNLLEINTKPVFIQLLKNQRFNYQEISKHLELISTTQANPNNQEITVLVTDSGMPGISDPGREVIELAQQYKVRYTILPGATSSINAVVASGFVSKEFTFLGFLPIKKGRKTAWQSIIRSQYPTVIFESVHRFEKFLLECIEYLEPERRICVCRELTKTYETIWVGVVSELDSNKIGHKGEYVIVIDHANK